MFSNITHIYVEVCLNCLYIQALSFQLSPSMPQSYFTFSSNPQPLIHLLGDITSFFNSKCWFLCTDIIHSHLEWEKCVSNCLVQLNNLVTFNVVSGHILACDICHWKWLNNVVPLGDWTTGTMFQYPTWSLSIILKLLACPINDKCKAK